MQWRITPKFLASGEHKKKSFVGYETTSKLFFSINLSRVHTKITPNNFRFIILNPTQRTSKSAQDFYRRNKDKNVHQPLCIDYPSPRESASWVPKHISSESIWYPIVTMGIHSKTCIKCSQIHKSIESDNNKISKGKLNSTQQDRERETPYDPTILTKPAIHQDCEISRTWERERERD